MHLMLLALAACAGKPLPPGKAPTSQPIDGVEYLNAWALGTTSPKDALGRFVEEGQALDGESGRRTACSEWFDVQELDLPSRPPVLMGATPATADWLGGPDDGDATFWLDFAPRSRTGAVVRDPHGLAECCSANPDSCGPSYVSEILSGAGKAYRLDRTDGAPAWYKAKALDGPYLLRVTGNPYAGPECGSWRDNPPRAATGTFLLGVSTATRSEENARADATRKAKDAARGWLKQAALGDSLLARMTEERWCVESFQGQGGSTEWIAQVLAYLPSE